MQRLTQLIFFIFSLRTAMLLVAVWLLVSDRLPAAFLHAQDQIQTHIFRLGLAMSELPTPKTQLTVIHVPDEEYDHWLVDLSGSVQLEQLFDKKDESAILGLVLERPLTLAQPAAEELLGEIQRGRKARDVHYTDVQDLLARREKLLTALTAPSTVLGLMDQSSHEHGIVVEDGFTRYPQALRDWLWPWPAPLPETVISPELQYFPIDSAPSPSRRLASLEDDQVVPMFPLQFWAASQHLPPPESGPEQVLSWRRGRGFAFGIEEIATSVKAEITPLYGAFSGIRASMRQVALSAVLGGEKLTGWILVGRDSSPVLEQSAQMIASLGDGAFLVEPVWWPVVQKALMVGAAVFLVLLVPLWSLKWGIGISATALLALAGGQLVGQSLFGYWLPCGDVWLFIAVGLPVMLLWRLKKKLWLNLFERADAASRALASIALAEGRLEDTWRHLRPCRSTPETLDALYQLGQRYELIGDFANALRVFKHLRRRRWRYRDVSVQIKRLRACLSYQQIHDQPSHEEGFTDDAARVSAAG